MSDKEQQALSIIVNGLKANFVKIEHEIYARWDRASKIKDFLGRIEEYCDIFEYQEKVEILMRETIRTIKEYRLREEIKGEKK